ncbi:flavodoxin domain-containing protein [Nocardia nova]|uniref:flavodoxin domain-containing protein n=1 Tax=Nocardia nova TaxID=37330 RepID=UPI00371077EF
MTSEPVLVAYGSTRGGTAEMAEWIGESLRSAGVDAEVRDAREVRSLDGYGAVVLGGALYTGRWHRHARRFARRFARQLRMRPVWLFASGPLDDSLASGGPEKVAGLKAVERAARRVNARDYTIFGGRLQADAHGFPAAAMAKTMAGDFRDPRHVHEWASGLAVELVPGPR